MNRAFPAAGSLLGLCSMELILMYQLLSAAVGILGFYSMLSTEAAVSDGRLNCLSLWCGAEPWIGRFRRLARFSVSVVRSSY